MSRWSEVFEKHPIHQLLNQAAEYLETEVEDTDAAFEDERRRLVSVVENLRTIIAGLNPEFYPQQWLDQIHQHLAHQHFNNQLQAYSSSPQMNHLTVANDHITQYAPQIFNLASMSRQMEAQDAITKAQKAFGSFTESMETTANETDERFNNHEAELQRISEKAESLEAELATLDTSVAEKLSEWQSEFTDKQTTRAEEYSENQIARETKFEELLTEWNAKIDNQQADIEKTQKDKLQATLDHFQETGRAVLADVSQKHEEVKEIHKLVGRDSVAGGYQTSAGDEKKQANFWRFVSLACIAGTAIWLLIKYNSGFTPGPDGGVNWPDVITASSLTAILIYAASYTSRQSRMHRDNEKLLRSYALETKALDPFIASLEKKEQQAIKAELVRRMFGQQNAVAERKNVKLDDTTVKTLVDSVTDTVSEAANKLVNKG
ncbi:hypothetical protein [Roseobacter sp. A03A-229]